MNLHLLTVEVDVHFQQYSFLCLTEKQVIIPHRSSRPYYFLLFLHHVLMPYVLFPQVRREALAARSKGTTPALKTDRCVGQILYCIDGLMLDMSVQS